MRASRTYKLQLSEQGVDQFLACHCRLARMTREFIPYGTTLNVAISILDRCDPSEIAAELESPLCGQLGGPSYRFVGTTSRLAAGSAGALSKVGNVEPGWRHGASIM